jgi:hypothetical protein
MDGGLEANNRDNIKNDYDDFCWAVRRKLSKK